MSSATIDTQACLGTKMRASAVRRRKALERAFQVSPQNEHAVAALAAGAARAIRPAAHGFGTRTPCPTLEPILFPKLRIHFADFPCLHSSIDREFHLGDDAVMSTAGRERYSVLRIFKRAGALPDHQRAVLFRPLDHYLRCCTDGSSPGSRPRFYGYAAPSYSSGLDNCPRRRECGLRASAPSISGLVDSAGELLHTP
ncbi:hypothetical protein Syun_031885 [Stephania yunnanensis]|uniref:Uncharacterized protein n=1 Tax=Stephania yunnanensis TaxID=152371 RepID=A0AAP0E142_9MAGN